MSLYGAMFAGVSGLSAQSQALGMISDNIANVNTVGYKTTGAAFSMLVTRSTANFHAPGGVRTSAVAAVDRQGLLQSSANATDVALSGGGFFVVTDTSAPTSSSERFYTRAGQFSADSDGYLKSPSGHYLQGWATDVDGVPTAASTSALTSLEAVRVNGISGSAVATAAISMGLNLPASAVATDTETTTLDIYDSLGVSHAVTFTWTKQAAANQWILTAPTVAGSATIEEGIVGSGTPFSVTVQFNGDGTPLTFDGGGTPPDMALTWSNAALDSIVSFSLGTAGAVGTAKADGLTQFSSTYSVASIDQDGIQFGNFFGVSIDEDGIVTALYDNGQTLKVYKLPVATFANPNGLHSKTGTVFTEGAESGTYFLRVAGEANAGKIIASSLEASTSDIATEFTNMIITQRAYSANTRVITTADDMLDELIRIKR